MSTKIMADISNRTTDVTIYDEDGNAVDIIDDAGVKRLAVDADITAEVEASPFPDGGINAVCLIIKDTTELLNISLSSTDEKRIHDWNIASEKKSRTQLFVATNFGTKVDVDDFESYADDAALRAVWVESEADFVVNLETTAVDVFEGSQSMQLVQSGTITGGETNEVKMTFGSDQDWSVFQTIQFNNKAEERKSAITIKIEDNVAATFEFLFINTQSSFTTLAFDLTSATGIDMTKIKKLSFLVKNPHGHNHELQENWVDKIELIPITEKALIDTLQVKDDTSEHRTFSAPIPVSGDVSAISGATGRSIIVESAVEGNDADEVCVSLNLSDV